MLNPGVREHQSDSCTGPGRDCEGRNINGNVHPKNTKAACFCPADNREESSKSYCCGEDSYGSQRPRDGIEYPEDARCVFGYRLKSLHSQRNQKGSENLSVDPCGIWGKRNIHARQPTNRKGSLMAWFNAAENMHSHPKPRNPEGPRHAGRKCAHPARGPAGPHRHRGRSARGCRMRLIALRFFPQLLGLKGGERDCNAEYRGVEETLHENKSGFFAHDKFSGFIVGEVRHGYGHSSDAKRGDRPPSGDENCSPSAAKSAVIDSAPLDRQYNQKYREELGVHRCGGVSQSHPSKIMHLGNRQMAGVL